MPPPIANPVGKAPDEPAYVLTAPRRSASRKMFCILGLATSHWNRQPRGPLAPGVNTTPEAPCAGG